MVWRIQKQFMPGGRKIYGKTQSDLTFQPDRGGFVVGCQLGHLVTALERGPKVDSPVALLFDVFQNKGLGEIEDGLEVGPSIGVKKFIVRALRKAFKKVVIVEGEFLLIYI